MIEAISHNQYKKRSSTAIFGTLSPTSLKLESKVDSQEELKKQLNLKLKQDLLSANQKIANLEKELRNSRQQILPECKNNPAIDRNTVGKSFDSAHMRSTLHNMDIEEICRCFARLIESQCMKVSEKVNSIIYEYNSVFIEENSAAPDENNVYNWCRTIIAKGKLDKEAVVNAIVYLQRYMNQSKINVSSQTWKKLVFVTIYLASKGRYLDKILYELYSYEEIERMERSLLTLIEYNMKIKQSEYAHAYFLLRTYASSKDKSAPTKLLKLNKVLELQHHPGIYEQSKVSLLKSM